MTISLERSVLKWGAVSYVDGRSTIDPPPVLTEGSESISIKRFL